MSAGDSAEGFGDAIEAELAAAHRSAEQARRKARRSLYTTSALLWLFGAVSVAADTAHL